MQLRNVSKKSETLMLMMKILASPLFSPFSEKNVVRLLDSKLFNLQYLHQKHLWNHMIHKRGWQIGGGGVKIC